MAVLGCWMWKVVMWSELTSARRSIMNIMSIRVILADLATEDLVSVLWRVVVADL